MTKKIHSIDISKHVLKALTKAGYGDDSNKETNITKAGMFDVLDALSGKDNRKFTKAQAEKEYNRRFHISKEETKEWN